jgi:hypothetical protein
VKQIYSSIHLIRGDSLFRPGILTSLEASLHHSAMCHRYMRVWLDSELPATKEWIDMKCLSITMPCIGAFDSSGLNVNCLMIWHVLDSDSRISGHIVAHPGPGPFRLDNLGSKHPFVIQYLLSQYLLRSRCMILHSSNMP